MNHIHCCVINYNSNRPICIDRLSNNSTDHLLVIHTYCRKNMLTENNCITYKTGVKHFHLPASAMHQKCFRSDLGILLTSINHD